MFIGHLAEPLCRKSAPRKTKCRYMHALLSESRKPVLFIIENSCRSVSASTKTRSIRTVLACNTSGFHVENKMCLYLFDIWNFNIIRVSCSKTSRHIYSDRYTIIRHNKVQTCGKGPTTCFGLLCVYTCTQMSLMMIFTPWHRGQGIFCRN